MDTKQLYDCMVNDYWITKMDFGVYPRDHLPDCTHPGLYIVNVDASSQPGSHWLLIWVDSNCNGYVFDSLGSNQLYTPVIENIIHGNCFQMVNRQLQCDESNVCGGYALYFARELAKHGQLCNVLEPFILTCVTNDVFVRNYISLYFNVIL